MTRREHVQAVLARCYVAMAEADYDLRRWADLVYPSGPMTIDLRRQDRARVTS